MLNTQEILSIKGYKGSNNLSEILNWLHSYGIFIEVGIQWNADGSLMQGYYGKLWMAPYESMWVGPACNTFSAAIDIVICKALDFLPSA